MTDPIWRAEVSGVTKAAFTDEQREELVSALGGFASLHDNSGNGFFRAEFDVAAPSEHAALYRGAFQFASVYYRVINLPDETLSGVEIAVTLTA